MRGMGSPLLKQHFYIKFELQLFLLGNVSYCL